MDKITQILENVVRCNYFEAGVHIKNPMKNSYQDGLGRTTQTSDYVVVVHILIWDKRRSQTNEYSDLVDIPYDENKQYFSFFFKKISSIFLYIVETKYQWWLPSMK